MPLNEILTIEQINLIENTAIVIVVYETKGKMLGNPIQGRFRYLRNWSIFDGQFAALANSCQKTDTATGTEDEINHTTNKL